jgi:hypothetical protein
MNQKANLRHGSVLVGFVPIPLAEESRLYSGLRLVASLDNTGPIFISPRDVVATDGQLQGYPLRPGDSLELQIDSPRLFAVATDYQQTLDWIGA